MDRMNDDRRAFTLIEVLLVIVILGLLATVLVFTMGGTEESAKKNTTVLLLKQVGNALDRYKLAVGHYPTEEEGGLQSLVSKPSFQDEKLAEKWTGPYLEKLPKDAWDRDLKYEVVEKTGSDEITVPYKLISSGPDGEEGTDDDISNIPKEDELGTSR